MIRPVHRTLLIALGALVLLNVGVYFAFTLPRSLQLRNLDQRLRAASQEVGVERARVAALQEHFDLIVANTRDTTDFLSRRLGRREETLVPMMRDVESMARAHGLKVSTQGFDVKPVKGLEVDRFEIMMPVKGSYHDLVAFVEELERSSRFVTLDQVSARTAESGQVELRMTLSGYFRSLPGREGA